MREFSYTVTEEDVKEGLSCKDLLRRRFSFSSRLRSRIKRENCAYVDGRNDFPIWQVPPAGAVLSVVIPDEKSAFPPEDIPIRPLYEDEDLLLIDKPVGYVCHPTKGHASGTIANGVTKYMMDTGQLFKIRFINRLDMDTSGVLALGKNSHAQAELVKQMKRGEVQKTYVSLVRGIIREESGTIDLPLGFDPEGSLKRTIDPEGKASLTEYRVLERFPAPADGTDPGYTLVELSLGSGRTHQIRVHMAAIGHPVAGDFLYGIEEPELTGHHLLHAKSLTFRHPVSGEPITCEAPLPDDFTRILETLRSR